MSWPSHIEHTCQIKFWLTHKEVARGTVFYMHGEKLYSVTCTGQDIGAWEGGIPRYRKRLLDSLYAARTHPRERAQGGKRTEKCEYSPVCG